MNIFCRQCAAKRGVTQPPFVLPINKECEDCHARDTLGKYTQNKRTGEWSIMMRQEGFVPRRYEDMFTFPDDTARDTPTVENSDAF